MKLGEIYQIYFDSRATNKASPINADICDFKYRVNWATILPEKYKQYQCKVLFKSESLDVEQFSNATQSGFVSMNFGKTNMCDGININSNKVAFIFPRSYYPSTLCYANDGFDDDNIFTIERPVNDIVEVSIRQSFHNYALIDDMPNYLLVLNLQGIIEEDENH